MASHTFDITSIVSATGWTGASVANLTTSNDVRATDGVAGEVILAEVADVPGDFGSADTVVLSVEWRISGAASRAKNLLLELVDSTGVTVFATFTTPSLTAAAADVVHGSSALDVSSRSAAELNGARLRCTVQEGGGMSDSVTVSIDRLWATLEYQVAAQQIPVGQAVDTSTALAVGRSKNKPVGQAVETDSALAVTADPILYETFEGTGYENAGWSENPNTGTLDEDFATSGISGGSPSGWGDQCFRLVRPGGEANKSTSPEHDPVADGYWNFDILPVSDTLADGQASAICSIATGTAGILVVHLRQIAGGALRFRFQVTTGAAGGSTNLDWTTNINLGQRYIVEFRWVAATSYEIWVDGASVFSGSTAYTGQPVNVGLGANDTTAGGVEILFDRVYVSEIRRLAAPAGGPNVGQAQETDSAFAVTHIKSELVGFATEANTATTITVSKNVQVGIASEASSAFAVDLTRTEPVGISSETDTALQATASKNKLVGQSNEADTAFSVVVSKQVVVGIAVETNTAFAVEHTRIEHVGLAVEANSALLIAVQQGNQIPVSRAEETDTALSISASRDVSVGQASETTTALTVTSVKSVDVGIASEIETALAAMSIKSKNVETASETATAFTITAVRSVSLGIASEIDSALVITIDQGNGVSVGIAAETDVAQPITVTRVVTLEVATETDAALLVGVLQGGGGGGPTPGIVTGGRIELTRLELV